MTALAVPPLAIYLLSEHPLLAGRSVWGWASEEILWLHAALMLAVIILSALFSRSRPALMALLLFAFALILPHHRQEADLVSLSLVAGGLFVLASPDRRPFRPSTLIWLGLAATGAMGVATVLQMSQQSWASPAVAAGLVVWGVPLLILRVGQDRARSLTEPMLLASLVGASFLGQTVSWNETAFSPAGFQALALLLALPCLASLIAHSFRLAYIDELTEIPGRRALVEALDDPGGVFTLAMLDVDHFKKFNDTHGHEVGDQVLRMVAARIASVGMGGAAYRYGGEEFTLLFPGKTTEQVSGELERLRQLVESSPLVLRGEDRPKEKPRKQGASKSTRARKKSPSVGVTVSIGVATRRTSEPWDRVMKRADQALYKAKEAGRNQISEAG